MDQNARNTLSVDGLLARARAETGLDDYGDMWFLEPLSKLVDWVNAEAGLIAPDAGAGMRIASALSDRLKLVQYFKDHPEAHEEAIDVACVVVGLPRTGSTVVQRLLASSPKLTSLFWWETTFPLPFPGEVPGDPTPRQEMARQVVDSLLELWPDFESIDPIEAMVVSEEVILLDRTFLSTSYDSMMNVPSYGFWMADQDHAPAYRDLLLWLKAIQHQSPWRHGRQWVLKTPHHVLGGMNGLLAVFPDAKLVMTNRDVADVLPSYCSMCASMSVNTSTTYRREVQGAYWTARFKTGLERFAALRRTLPAGQVIDIDYRDTVSDPIGTLERVMIAVGLGFDAADREAAEACMADNVRDKRPRHKYSAEEFGLSQEQIARDFAFMAD
ncbi:sulfotransferase [Novosphingobium sp. FKTRR1]|uniref:sulfotransferase family protein n=1 Tax=Novosphingobium sp. FKTRR1 TaxID=2879118 RepID=UPI001CF09A23|nr:sulfotransferase [Novosphingobium sp. FKTRR1]